MMVITRIETLTFMTNEHTGLRFSVTLFREFV